MATIKSVILPKFQINIPRLTEISDHQLNPAEWAHERLVRSIIDFEKGLDDDKEIGARMVSFTENQTFHIKDVGYWGPDFVIFYGTNRDGSPIELIQHISQVSVLLVAMPKEGDEPRRIGFDLEKRLEQDGKEDESGMDAGDSADQDAE